VSYTTSVTPFPTPTTPRREDENVNAGYSVPCGCGHIFTGEYAKGNLMRHQKSLSCKALRETREYLCSDCGQIFRRSDALLNHRRKRHGAPPGRVRLKS
jgi:uncharacterized C2H2 Zn-finger protein